MIIQVQNIFNGKLNEMDLPITINQLNKWLHGREKIQDVFPHLSSTEREFLLTGMSAEEQNKFYKRPKE